MQIDTTRLYANSTANVPEFEAEPGSSYAEVVVRLYPADPYRTRDKINAEDVELQAFKEDLTSKGALRFFVEFNLEKIEKMVEAYRAKLEAYAKENPDADMEIEDMVAAYRKQLMEQFMSDDKEKAGLVNPSRAAAELLPDDSKSLDGTLEGLLQARDDSDTGTVLI